MVSASAMMLVLLFIGGSAVFAIVVVLTFISAIAPLPYSFQLEVFLDSTIQSQAADIAIEAFISASIVSLVTSVTLYLFAELLNGADKMWYSS